MNGDKISPRRRRRWSLSYTMIKGGKWLSASIVLGMITHGVYYRDPVDFLAAGAVMGWLLVFVIRW